MARIIDFVLVDDDRGDQSTELDQHMPVAAIAGETRGLDREHRADVSGADCADQTIKAGAGDAASRAAKVIIDDLDASPAELPSAIGRPIPVPSYSNDERFEHMAIVVRDMDVAYK